MKEQIEKFAEEKLEGEVAAGIDHFRRDYGITKKLAEQENLDYDDEVLHAACFLRDLEDDSGEEHNISAQRMAESFLKEIGFPAEKIEIVKEAIREHLTSGNPQSNEAKLLHDADLIDFLGATGIIRLSIGAWDWMGKMTLAEFVPVFEKFRKDCEENLVLNASKKMVKEKVEFMDRAIEELKKE